MHRRKGTLGKLSHRRFSGSLKDTRLPSGGTDQVTGGYPLVTLGNLACQYTLVALKDSSCRGEGKETTTSDTKPRLKEKKNRQLSSRKRESTTTLICGFEPIGGSSNDRSVGQAASPESKSVDYNADQSNEIIPARHQARFSGSLITNRIGKKENRKKEQGRPHSIKQVPELRAGRMKSTNLRGNPGVTEGYSDSSSEQKLILFFSFYSRVTFRADSEKEEAHEAVAATSSASSSVKDTGFKPGWGITCRNDIMLIHFLRSQGIVWGGSGRERDQEEEEARARRSEANPCPGKAY
uniref:Uncharacterized protein n=1 Tax=Salix viminalis TaxID=40686 RepID=A0A6N2KZ38_SALVM